MVATQEYVSLPVPVEHYEDTVKYLASVLTRDDGGKLEITNPSLSQVVYERGGVRWTADDVRDLAAASKKWPSAEVWLRTIAESAPEIVTVESVATKLGISTGSLGGRLSGLGKWVKSAGKMRSGRTVLGNVKEQAATVWPFEVVYDTAGLTCYRMSESVAKSILQVL